MKGIILAGGKGSRLYPLTNVISKQLLPVYDKPMIYYPLSMLMLGGLREILVITTPEDQLLFQRLLGTGEQWGISFEYAGQAQPRGLAEALIIGEEFLDGKSACLTLGDNIFYGTGLVENIKEAVALNEGAVIFAYPVNDPQNYGVVEFDEQDRVLSLEEKPQNPRSNYAVPGMYFFDRQAPSLAKSLKPSNRGELEITDLNRLYLQKSQLTVKVLGRGVAWLDAGTHDSLLQASNFIQAVEQRQGVMISSPEEIALRMGFIDQFRFQALINGTRSNSYFEYLKRLGRW